MKYLGIDTITLSQAISDAGSVFPVQRDYITAKAEAMFLRWAYAFLPVLEVHDVLEVESEFAFELLNPETGGSSKTFLEAGKKDGVLRHRATREIKLLEHKTTSDQIGADSDYWAALVMDTQISKYIIDISRQYPECRSVLYNVMRKPAHRPLNVPVLDADDIKQVVNLEGERVRTKDGKKWRESASVDDGYSLITRKETPDEYYVRLHDEIESDPFNYFVQREIVRSNRDLEAYMKDAWSQSQVILYNRRNALWPKNPDACHQYSTCEMFNLCAGRASVDGINYARKEVKHAELSEKTNSISDKSLLTNSSLRALRKCPQYYFLKYEEPVERVGDDKEALILGSYVHAAIEAFLKPFIVL